MTDKITESATVTVDQLRAAYDALGLDPDQFTRTRSVEITPQVVVVTRYVRGEGVGFEVATETTWLDVVHSAPAPAVLGNGEQA